MKQLELNNVYGYPEVKDELTRLKGWYEDETIVTNPNITLPKGVLFYGGPGNGKTLFVREFLNNFDVPKFSVEGRNENTASEIQRVFEKAKKEKFAIVVIDELELLVPKGSKAQRTLQQELDGVVQKGTVLVLATANDISEVASPLKRPGRFDKRIHIGEPDRESRKQIFGKMLEDLGIDTANINLDHVSKHCTGISGATIKAICNDVYLRCKDSLITEEEIELSYERVKKGELGKVPATANDFNIAIHEAGHALLALHFKENWSLYKAKFTEEGGQTEVEEVKENNMTLEKRIQGIMIGCGGYVAEEVIFGYHEYGCYDDYEKSHDYCRRLVERSCVYGVKHHITDSNSSNAYHRHSPRKERKIETLTYRLMRKYEGKVRRFFKAHKKELVTFANHMCEHNSVSYRDIESLGLTDI